MYIVKCENYENNFFNECFSLVFNSLDEIFEYLASTSRNFKTGVYLFSANHNGDIYVLRPNSSKYSHCFVHLIRDTDKGIIFSDGTFTNEETFCSRRCEEWLDSCKEKAKYMTTHRDFDFAFDD